MITKSDSYRRIIEVYDDLSKQQKKIADGIINRYDEIVFFSITQLANFLGVSEATIVRFAQHLGHKGFPELKEDLVKYYREYLTPGERMRRSIEEFPDDPLLYKSHAARDIQLLEESLLAVDNESFVHAVEAIVRADRVFLFGNGGNACLADHLAFRLSRFKLKAISQSVSGKNLFEKLLQVEKSDLIIAYHFYKPTIDFRRLMEVSAERQVPVVLMTDSLVPPMIRHAEVILFAPRGSAGTFHSQVVPLSINNALINAVASKLGDKAVQALQELSDMRRKHYFSDFSSFAPHDTDQ